MTAASVQAAALRARALLATGRRAQAARIADDGLRLATGADGNAGLVSERAELHEMRGLARLSSRNATRVAAAERDLSHAVALYLAAGLADRARELSTRFLPEAGLGVHRGGFLSDQPPLPLPDLLPGRATAARSGLVPAPRSPATIDGHLLGSALLGPLFWARQCADLGRPLPARLVTQRLGTGLPVLTSPAVGCVRLRGRVASSSRSRAIVLCFGFTPRLVA